MPSRSRATAHTYSARSSGTVSLAQGRPETPDDLDAKPGFVDLVVHDRGAVEHLILCLQRRSDAQPRLEGTARELAATAELLQVVRSVRREDADGVVRMLHEEPADQIVAIDQARRLDLVRQQEQAGILDPALAAR